MIQDMYDDAFWDGFIRAVTLIQEEIKLLRSKKRTNMTADYAWALEDIDTIIKKVEKFNTNEE